MHTNTPPPHEFDMGSGKEIFFVWFYGTIGSKWCRQAFINWFDDRIDTERLASTRNERETLRLLRPMNVIQLHQAQYS